MKSLLKFPGITLLLFVAACDKNDPACLPYEGIIVQAKNACLADRAVLQLINKNINSVYYNGRDSLQNVVAAVFPDTSSLQSGQKVYFDYEASSEPYLTCLSLQAFPEVQVKITRLSYQPCPAN